jgi:hypothetical protein
MVLLDSGLNGMSSLSKADTLSVTGNAVYAEETGNVFRWEANISDVFRQCPANAVEGWSNKG